MKNCRTTTTASTISSKLPWLLCLFASLLVGCAGRASISSRQGYNRAVHMIDFYETEAEPVGTVLSGEASYYGPGFHGNKTASGEKYNQNGMTCAHKTLPFNTVLKVTLPTTERSVEVRVNDRGPYKDGRILDLSTAAAKKLGLAPLGVAEVQAEVVKTP